MTEQLQASSLDTLRALLERSVRDEVPVRRGFVQLEDQNGEVRGGPLAKLVRHHDERALDFYLIILAACSSDKRTGSYDVSYDARVWARALSIDSIYKSSAVSKVLGRLVDLNLIRRDRVKRQSHITLLREDGSGEEYSRPTGRGPGNAFFQLHRAYWLDGWHERLRLSAKAILLIALSLPDYFFLPSKQAPRWFGISPDTAEDGLWQLREAGLLDRQKEYKRAPLTPEGFTTESRYTLLPPFGPHSARPRRRAPSPEVNA